jgi:hypothetical protein
MDVLQPGQTVLLRRRPALVREVRRQGGGRGGAVTHLVEVEYLDGWDHPRHETVLWELEEPCGAQLLSRLRLPLLADPHRTPQPDHPDRFDAFLDAVRWGHAAHHAVLEPEERQDLLAPWHSAVQQEDYQLYPLWKSLLMPRVALLLADDVGLGKTIEAGLILTELIQRRSLRRILVVCPASLQRQWQEELEDKFNLRFAILDGKEAARITREQGTEVNPWAVTPRAITSMTYLAQEEVKERFRAAAENRVQSSGASAPWDVLIVDEAHNFAPSSLGSESRRTRMLREINPFFEHRLFLTATPHNGYTWSFTGLLELLDPVRFHQAADLSETQQRHRDAVMVRRLKRDLNTDRRQRFADREVKEVVANLTAEEKALFEALREYRDQARRRVEHESGDEGRRSRSQVRFLFSMLSKRLLSSSFAFARTWWQHVEGLDLDPVALTQAEAARRQAEASAESDEEQQTRDEEAVRQGSAWFRGVADGLDAQRQAVTAAVERIGWTRERVGKGLPDTGSWSPADGRFAALESWVATRLRVGDEWRADERLLLFTEYKDTLAYLLWRLRRLGHDAPEILHLYGGMDLAQREPLKDAFRDPSDPVRVLVATDAASEGINLQDTCRYVFHFDIPWNPMRLEQRNGRVDRHGQARDVTCFHLTSTDATEMEFLAKVAVKMHDAREDVGSVGETLAQAVEDRLVLGRGRDEDFEQRLEAAQADDESRQDLAGADRGSEGAYQGAVQRLQATELRLGLSPEALHRLFLQAVALAGGELEATPEAGLHHLRKVPPGWRTLVEARLRVRKGANEGAQPKVCFDSRLLEEEVNGRRVFRPRPDVVLLRLGHPLMQRAAATLQRAMWEEEAGVHRWTVRAAALPARTEAMVVVQVLLQSVNKLRETVEAGLQPMAFVLREDAWTLLPEATTLPGHALPSAAIPAAIEPVRAAWDELQDLLREHLEDEQEQHRQALDLRMAQALGAEEQRESERYASRLKELKEQERSATGKRLQKTLERLRKQRDETFVTEMRQQFEHDIQSIEESRKKDFATLKGALERERDRILERVLPQRFALARTTLTPVAVDLLVPEPAR